MLPAGDQDEVDLSSTSLLLHLVGCLYHCISDARSHNIKNSENFVFYHSHQSGCAAQADTHPNGSGCFVLRVKAA